MADPSVLSPLQERLNCRFRDEGLLQQALTHKSYVNENRGLGLKDNERMEFLGDAVLDLVVSELLFKAFPAMSEGDLSKKRSALVREECLADLARGLRLGDLLLLGKGEALSGGREKNSLLADTFEATVAAVYLDGGMDLARGVVEAVFAPLIEAPQRISDYKSALQELCMRMKRLAPCYRVVAEEGPDHDKTFEVVLEIEGEPTAQGRGKSIKEAEQVAAERALRTLETHDR